MFAAQKPALFAQLARAEEMGREHGENAASWYFDGNTTLETYRAVLTGMEDGDPAILDTFPCSPLSGEWADDPTPRSVLADLGVEEDSEDADTLLWEYEDAFARAVEVGIEGACLRHLLDA